jgi:hypothetical protein
MYPNSSMEFRSSTQLKWVAILLMSTIMLSLVGCGSTKVYTADKTIVHRDSIYNVSNVKVFSAKTEGVISETETINLKGADKKRINALLDANDTILVRQVINLDDQELVYQAKRIKSYSEFSKMNKQFSSANSTITKFLANKKKTQLKLK